MRHLALIRGEARSTPALPPPPVVLSERTQRPGELADLVPIRVDGDVYERVRARAERAGLPLALYVVVVVESERVLAEVATATAITTDELAAALDAAASDGPASAFEPRASRPLRAYARALRSGGYKSQTHVERAELALIVPDRLRARWSLAAQEAGLPVADWIISQLRTPRLYVERWEAEAAADGRTLAEWITLQALRRPRRSSTSAQADAAG